MFLPGESHGQRSLEGYSPWGRESQTRLKRLNHTCKFVFMYIYEASILWPPDAKSWLIGKDPDPGKDWGQEKGTAEDVMAGWHHQLDGQEFGWTLGIDVQGSLVWCNLWNHKELDTTERLNWLNSFSPISVVSSAIWGCSYFFWKSWYQLVLLPAHHFSWCTLHII